MDDPQGASIVQCYRPPLHYECTPPTLTLHPPPSTLNLAIGVCVPGGFVHFGKRGVAARVTSLSERCSQPCSFNWVVHTPAHCAQEVANLVDGDAVGCCKAEQHRQSQRPPRIDEWIPSG